MNRQFKVRGTRNYLYWCVGLFALGLYAAWDGWFPRASVIQKHPDPGEWFYMFNKILAVASFIGSALAGYIHTVVK